VIICEIIVHLLIIVQNNKRPTVHGIAVLEYIPVQQEDSINIQTVYTATTLTDFIITTKLF